MRLDKFLTAMNVGSRSQVKELLKKGRITINGQIVKTAYLKINENTDEICFDGNKLSYQKFEYFMLNKPQGVVSATKDNVDQTVLDLLKGHVEKDSFPVGRLDKDTEGLLLITNDGELAHLLLSPKRHVDKTYYVKCRDEVSKEACKKLEVGVDIGEDDITMPAKVQRLSDNEILLTIQEGKFHQVKRMLNAVENEVVFLKRMTFGTLKLDENLAPGEFRRLTEEEIEELKLLSKKKA